MTASWQLECAIVYDALATLTAARMQPEAARRFWGALQDEVSKRRRAALRSWAN